MKNKLKALFAVASAAFFIAPAQAQNAGTVTNHAFAIGKGPGTTGYTSLLCGSAQLAVGQAAADPICRTLTGDVTLTAAGVTAIGAGKVTNSMIAPMTSAQLAAIISDETGTGALVFGTSPVLTTPNLGTPSAATLTNATGLPIATGVSGLGTGVATFLATPSSANLRAALTDETGTGAAYFQGGALGTPSSATLTNATGLPLATGVTGNLPLANLATGSQDTVLGYWGSTTASALAINNCANALTYSTSTHTFGCNMTAGTGTVTQVNTSGLATGGPITSTGTVTVTAATKASQQIGTDATTAVTPARQQDHDSAAKAWVSFNSSGTILASYNVTSVNRTSAGSYTITFTTPFASASYVCLATPSQNGTQIFTTSEFGNKGAGSITAFFAIGGTGTDPNVSGDVVCFGRQ